MEQDDLHHLEPSTSSELRSQERKGSTSSVGSGPSFTQRLIERGVAVPSSFSGWDNRLKEDSPSPNSFDFDTYYGMSPFITPSFSTAAEKLHDGPLYKSLRHRYEKEKTSARALSNEEEEELIKKAIAKKPQTSDIELSDEEEQQEENKYLGSTSKRSRSRSPLAFPPSFSDSFIDLGSSEYKNLFMSTEEEPKVLSPQVEKWKNILITKPTVKEIKPLPSPPRRHLLQTPVFQVVNANTVKDRYLFLFNDLLLICKPIMDENIIVSNNRNNDKNRYRFRPNENSLFQVKNIVPLGQLTLYLSRDDLLTRQATQTTVELDKEGKPILPPARKIHPIMASALRKFETNANLGIQYLVDKNVLTYDPLSIANFLFKTPDLNRRQLGYYLSDEKNSDVYDAFLECFRLVGLRLDEALRILLTTFRLPSHWEALEYLIERFAKKWHDANQNVIKFHEDMVVKVLVAMLFLNAECWYDAASERDVFWYARELKERQDRQAKRKMSVIDYRHNAPLLQKSSTSAKTSNQQQHRQSVSVEPLHYIMSLRDRGKNQPSLDEFINRWNYYDQYHLVDREFMEEMYKSIMEERLETGWDNKTGRRTTNDSDTIERPKVVSPSVQQGSQDVVITVIPHKLPTRLTKGVPSEPITISIPAADKGLQIKLRGQDLVFEPNVLDFSTFPIQTFTITGNTLGRTSLMFIKTGENAGNYVSPTLPRTKSVVVEHPFMRFTFQIGFKHLDINSDKYNKKGDKKEKDDKEKKEHRQFKEPAADEEEEDQQKADVNKKEDENMINRKYMFSVETYEERIEWLEALKALGGHVNEETNVESTHKFNTMSSECRVALQVLKEVLLADDIKKGTARKVNTAAPSSTAASIITTVSKSTSAEEEMQPPSLARHNRTMNLLLPSKQRDESDRNSILSTNTTTTTANVVTKRGYEIVKLVVQNSMVPLVLSFLKNQMK